VRGDECCGEKFLNETTIFWPLANENGKRGKLNSCSIESIPFFSTNTHIYVSC